MKHAALFLGTLILMPLPARPADAPASAAGKTAVRQEALELFDQHKMAQALPLLQKLADENPRDTLIWERCGVAMVSYSQTLTDPAQRKLARAKAREILLKARDLGDDSNLLKTLLNMIPPDGGEGSYSGSREADDIMQQAEADFARGDFDKALDGYNRALIIDPQLYTAALFSGDARFKQDKNDLACEWYDRATHIDPDRETAWRYWGDSLMAMGRMDDARTKFIEAVVAEPYVDRPWTGLGQWADRNNVKLTPLGLRTHGSVTTASGSTTINIDSSVSGESPDSAAWTTYGIVRAGWQAEKFKTAFPAETAYRHTLQEETEALHAMVGVIHELEPKPAAKGGKRVKPADPALIRLMEIDKAGLLEAFILLERADEGIAKDYPAYRAANRDKIRRYLDEFVVPRPAK